MVEDIECQKYIKSNECHVTNKVYSCKHSDFYHHALIESQTFENLHHLM